MNWFNNAKKSGSVNEESLLKRYQETDNLELLAELFQAHSSMVYYVCLRYLQDREMSKDAVMQIFEELIVKIKKQEIKNFGNWLYVLSRNHCLMQLRSAKKMEFVHFEDFVEFPESPHQEHWEIKERKLTDLELCLEKLPERQKQAVSLFFLQEKCYIDIMKDTGFSLNNLKSYLQNGKRNLKICMDKNREE
jgi:RNA polymerase sigma factor (sigma-70 family)